MGIYAEQIRYAPSDELRAFVRGLRGLPEDRVSCSVQRRSVCKYPGRTGAEGRSEHDRWDNKGVLERLQKLMASLDAGLSGVWSISLSTWSRWGARECARSTSSVC